MLGAQSILGRAARALSDPDFSVPLFFALIGGFGLGMSLSFRRGCYDTWTVISTTILLAGLIQTLTAIIRWFGSYGERRDFRRFFGNGEVEGIVPNYFAPALEPGHPPIDGARPEGTNAVPFCDLKAAISLAEMFEMHNVSFNIARDQGSDSHNERTKGAVALGLGFNSLTMQLSATSALFDVDFPVIDGRRQKDDFIVASERHPQHDEKHDFALIVRTPVPCQDHKVRPMFVCAGRCAQGTMAAGYFLKLHWRSLYNLYIDEHRSFGEPLAVELEYHPQSLMTARARRHSFPPPAFVKDFRE